jgi:hypothetical protein
VGQNKERRVYDARNQEGERETKPADIGFVTFTVSYLKLIKLLLR